MTTTHDPLTITDQPHLESAWRTLMGPGGFEHASLWTLTLDAAGRPCANLTEIADPPRQPDSEDATQVVRLLGEVAAEVAGAGARLAFLLSRPGPAHVDDADRLWAARLTEAGDALGMRVEPVHLATAGDVRLVTLDHL